MHTTAQLGRMKRLPQLEIRYKYLLHALARAVMRTYLEVPGPAMLPSHPTKAGSLGAKLENGAVLHNTQMGWRYAAVQ